MQRSAGQIGQLAPYAAYLRVYEPPEVLPGGFDAVQAARAGAYERELTLAAACRSPQSIPDHLVAAELVEPDGNRYVAPFDLEERSLRGLEYQRATVPGLLRLFSPTPHPSSLPPPHVQVWRWGVPPIWFALMTESNRHVATTPERRCVYRAKISSARRRLAIARAAISRILPAKRADMISGGIGRWLENFHAHSIVELDYGGLVRFFDEDALVSDTSVEDAGTVIDCLDRSDLAGAQLALGRITARWRSIAEAQKLN